MSQEFFAKFAKSLLYDYFAQLSALVFIAIIIIANHIIKKILAKYKPNAIATKFVSCIRVPTFWALIAIATFILLHSSLLSYASGAVIGAFAKLFYISLTLIATWGAIRVVNLFESHFATSDKIKSNLAIIGTVIKILIASASGVIILDKAGANVSGILTIGGIGGVALGFAGKDLFANFFGFLVIAFDQPFKIGDLISSSDRQIRGVVNKISWRVTKVISLEKKSLYIPNALFTTIVLENETDRLARRISENLKFCCTDITAIEEFTKKVNQYLDSSRDLNQSFPPTFSVTKVGSNTAEFRFISFTKSKEWNEFMQAKQRVLLEIEKIARQMQLRQLYPDMGFAVYENREEPKSCKT